MNEDYFMGKTLSSLTELFRLNRESAFVYIKPRILRVEKFAPCVKPSQHCRGRSMAASDVMGRRFL